MKNTDGTTMKYETKCEVEEKGVCGEIAIGILVWKKSEMALAVCQNHSDRVKSDRVELKRFDAEVA